MSTPQAERATVALRVRVNGVERQALVAPAARLADLLDDLGLAGRRAGCGRGRCDACTVMVDGLPVRACAALAIDVHGRDVRTVEALGEPDELGALAAAFGSHPRTGTLVAAG